jgi:hypothetical protein
MSVAKKLKSKADEKRRYFGGKLKVFVDRKATPAEQFKQRTERNFESKHLKAYLRGDKEFSFGKDNIGHEIIYKVNEIWT